MLPPEAKTWCRPCKIEYIFHFFSHTNWTRYIFRPNFIKIRNERSNGHKGTKIVRDVLRSRPIPTCQPWCLPVWRWRRYETWAYPEHFSWDYSSTLWRSQPTSLSPAMELTRRWRRSDHLPRHIVSYRTTHDVSMSTIGYWSDTTQDVYTQREFGRSNPL